MAVRQMRLEMGIAGTALLAFMALALFPVAGIWLREPVAPRAEPLPLSFPHSKHVFHSGCAHCHHNLKDDTGAGLPCIHCHKSEHPRLKRNIEGEFHDFCKGCHAEKARWFDKSGPVRECAGCHKATADGFLP